MFFFWGGGGGGGELYHMTVNSLNKKYKSDILGGFYLDTLL